MGTREEPGPCRLAGCDRNRAGLFGRSGLLTGTFTGIVDAPWQVARTFEGEFEEQPGWWAPNRNVVAPVGAVFRGLAGFGEGIVVDAQEDPWVPRRRRRRPREHRVP